MHIPDGYLSPLTCLIMFLLVLPFWVIGLRKIRQKMSARSVPLIALLAAFSFVIMMFNVPLPGGTTGHAVGGGAGGHHPGAGGRDHRHLHRADHPGLFLRRRRHPGHRRQLLQHGRGDPLRQPMRIYQTFAKGRPVRLAAATGGGGSRRLDRPDRWRLSSPASSSVSSRCCSTLQTARRCTRLIRFRWRCRRWSCRTCWWPRSSKGC